MNGNRFGSTTLFLLGYAVLTVYAAEPNRVDPAKMPRLGSVDERFQSFNVEMVEVTGGRFWAPYRTAGAAPEKAAPAATAAPGLDPTLFRNREPINLSNPRLRKLAAALGPAYVRVSGTWANSTYFHDSDDAPPKPLPTGFGGVLTREQWRGVVEFARATDAGIVTSFAISGGVRGPDGVWTPEQARKLVNFTRTAGGRIAAAEFFNEPNFASMGGAPKGYDAAAYGQDFKVFLPFVREASPATIVLGPGSVGEAAALGAFSALKSEDMLRETGRGVDAFSYHFYGAVSKRCAAMGSAGQATPEAALSPDWLSRTERDYAFYAGLRDRFEPGKPMWLTETAESACGGNEWAATFVDSFRYLEQLGRLARKGVQVVAHNTLAASDYGLIDESTMTPRPNYWAALLWRNLMGPTVLDAGESNEPGVHMFAHCLRDHPGGVTLLAVNSDREASHDLAIQGRAQRYTLTSAKGLLATTVELNGKELTLGSNGTLPEIAGKPVPAGVVKLEPASITFLAFPDAGNASCRTAP